VEKGIFPGPEHSFTIDGQEVAKLKGGGKQKRSK
jgi:hypothetical protein